MLISRVEYRTDVSFTETVLLISRLIFCQRQVSRARDRKAGSKLNARDTHGGILRTTIMSSSEEITASKLLDDDEKATIESLIRAVVDEIV